jgi:hypothetical protein
VKQFWSLTVYDVDTRSLIENEPQRADRSSREDITKNADGSVDLYVGLLINFHESQPHQRRS